MSITITHLEIPDLLLLKTAVNSDPRGSLQEVFKMSEFTAHRVPTAFVQDTLSHSRKHVLRGLHYQRSPMVQAKLVCCLRGEIYDVAADLRKSSPTFGKWAAQTLSGESGEMLFIPEGFAHGFLVLSDDAVVFYKCSSEYAPRYEGGVRWNDPRLAIQWPSVPVMLSEKDRHLPFLGDLQWEEIP